MVFLGLGSNLGDRAANIAAAVALLDQWPGIKVSRCSSLYETEPFGYKEQPDFVNAVVAVETVLEPEELLAVCLQIERQLGRQRGVNRWHPSGFAGGCPRLRYRRLPSGHLLATTGRFIGWAKRHCPRCTRCI